MAGKAKALGAVVKYGPIVYAAAQKYGPAVWEQVKTQREPAEKFVQAKVARGNQRKRALAHADTVVDGSVLQVFHQTTDHWVVFSGDQPVGVHPPASVSYEVLLRNADLSKKLRPEDAHRTVHLPRRSRRTPPPEAPGPDTARTDAAGSGTAGTDTAGTDTPATEPPTAAAPRELATGTTDEIRARRRST